VSHLATNANHEALRLRLQTLRDMLVQFQPLPWQGLGPLSESDPVDADILRERPWLGNPVTVHGKLVNAPAPLPALMVKDPAAGPWRWKVNPYLFVWPCFPPTVDEVSVVHRPHITARPLDFIYLRVQWIITPPTASSFGSLGCSSAQMFASSINDLTTDNDLSEITSKTTRVWHHVVGAISADGVLIPVGFDSPFVPPQL